MAKQKKENNNRELSVHHVIYDKETCCNDSERLFVTLCTSCHIKTNSNREYCQNYFTEIIYNNYGGKCYFTEEEYEIVKNKRENNKNIDKNFNVII